MKIYCAHSSAFDYQRDWYDVLRTSPLMFEHDLIFPHENESIQKNSYPMLQIVDCIIAEVSYPSTSMGIELGWSQTLAKPIVCFYKKGNQPSSSLGAVTEKCYEYDSPKQLLQLISHSFSHEMNHSQ